MRSDESAGKLPASVCERVGVIDVGSNSVRLLLCDGGNEKFVATTRLSAGLSERGEISAESMRRTAEAVARFAARARERRCGVFVFGTEAVRKASNRAEFLRLVKELSGLDVDILSGEEEARCGFLGVNGDERISVLDVGGASTELATGAGNLESALSVPVGTVRLFDLCGRDRKKLDEHISREISAYETVARAPKLYGIGGTATTLASTLLKLETYDRSRVHGFQIRADALSDLCDRFFKSSVEEIREFPGMDPRRADVIAGGAELVFLFLQRYGYEEMTVSETDNLEGYLALRRRKS